MKIIMFEYRKDEPFRVVKDECVGTLRTINGGGVSKYILEIQEENEEQRKQTNRRNIR